MSSSTTPADNIRSRLEAIAGHPIDLSDEQIAEQFVRFRPVAAYSLVPDGRVVSKNQLVPYHQPPICAPWQLLDIGGHAYTSSSGLVSLLISEFICPSDGKLFYAEPANILVTVDYPKPVLLTTTFSPIYTSINPLATDVQITVNS